MATPRIYALFCDLGNVVLWYELRSNWIWRLARYFNPDLTDADEAPFLDCLVKYRVLDGSQPRDHMFRWFDQGRVQPTQFYEAFLMTANRTPMQVPASRFWYAWGSHHQIIPEVCALLQGLKRPDLALIIATDADCWAGTDLTRLYSGVPWDGVVMSAAVGDTKPGVKFFTACRTLAETVLRRNLGWEHCLLLDDKQRNIDGFRELGGNAIQFKADRDSATLQNQIKVLQRQLNEFGIPRPGK